MEGFEDFDRMTESACDNTTWPAMAELLSRFRLVSMHIKDSASVTLTFERVSEVLHDNNSVNFSVQFAGVTDLAVTGWAGLTRFTIDPRGEGFHCVAAGDNTRVEFDFRDVVVRGVRWFRGTHTT